MPMIKVKNIMKTRVITADPGVSITHAAKMMTNNRVGSIIVIKSGKPVGIVTDDDIVGIVAGNRNPNVVKIRDIPVRKKFVTASPEETITEVTKKMIKNGIKRVPVVKNGKLIGIVSDKEILLVSPELLDILSEKLKMRVESVARPERTISGICEECGEYSDSLTNVAGSWLCEDCTD
ncbi:MAG TPA: CBS domain-containing protein [archaeon]|nr:CBS domain-containing protein [archaeon]